MTKQEFQKRCREGLLIMDGATGSNLMKAGMPKGVCTELWVLEHREVLQNLQRAYVEAGSDMVYAPTFGANRYNLNGLGMGERTREMNRELVSISREAVEGKAWVVGDITTTGKVVGSDPSVSYEKLLDIYKEQISCLTEAGVDLLGAETLLSLDEAMLIADAAAAVSDLPLMVTLTVQADGNAYFGGSAVEAAAALPELGVSAVGINCSVGPDQLSAIVKGMREATALPVIVKPNAGMPVINEKGEAEYQMKPEEFLNHMRGLKELGANIIGGCCGTTPDFIRELQALR